MDPELALMYLDSFLNPHEPIEYAADWRVDWRVECVYCGRHMEGDKKLKYMVHSMCSICGVIIFEEARAE